MDDFAQMLNKEEGGRGGGEELQFAFLNRRGRSCAVAPVRMASVHASHGIFTCE